jgi:hypothetical protein
MNRPSVLADSDGRRIIHSIGEGGGPEPLPRLRPPAYYGYKYYGYTASEWKWLWNNSYCCLRDAMRVKDEVNSIIVETWRSGLDDNDFRNAARHCTWMCAEASLRSCGKESAIALGNAHEDYKSNEPHSKAMDLYNNSVGVSLATPGATVKDCLSRCKQALAEHKLFFFKARDTQGPYEYEFAYPTFTIDKYGRISGGTVGGTSSTPPEFQGF